MLEETLGPTLERGSCPHLAALVKSYEDLPAVLASFYALGASREAWIVHRPAPGRAERDRTALIESGLDVPALEAAGRFTLAEFDPAERPETWTEPWAVKLEEALAQGRSGLWCSRFAVAPDDALFALALPYERAWEDTFHGRPVVTLCPYIVGGLSSAAVLGRLNTLADVHDGVLVPSGDGYEVVDQAAAR